MKKSHSPKRWVSKRSVRFVSSRAEGDKAEKWLEASKQNLDKAIELSGPESDRAGKARLMAVQSLIRMERWQEANALHEPQLEIDRRIRGEDNPVTLLTETVMSVISFKMGESKRARQLLFHVFTVRSATLGPNHPDTLEVSKLMAQLDSAERPDEK
ncbi:MAG: tetratricopeptide repeat protein [Acidimicrobiales bacterium]